MVMLVRLLQFLNAQLPILVTLSGMVRLVRQAQLLKEYHPILVTFIPYISDGISTLVAFNLQAVMVISSPLIS